MKKFILKLPLWYGLLLCITLSANGQQTDWDYPIKIGSKEWSDLTDVKERVKVCQVPAEIVSKLSTKQLFTLCIKHPFFRSYGFSNSPIEGFKNSMESFNGYNELLKRSDALEYMVAYYEKENFSKVDTLKTDVAKGDYSLTVHGIELMMSNETLINRLDVEKRKSFLKTVQSKYEEKVKYKEELSGFGSVTTAFLAAKLMVSISDLNLAPTLSANPKLISFQKRMIPFDKDVVDTILKNLQDSVTLIK